MNERICSIEDCPEPIKARGWCNAHWLRWKRHGDPTGGGARIVWGATLEERFWSKVDKRSPDECWPWTAYLRRDGYGEIGIEGGKTALSFRVAYELVKGPIPAGLRIDHVCHNGDLSCPGGVTCRHRACCNPGHLEAVTAKENTRRSHATESAKTRCPQGHSYEDAYVDENGHRRCRTCRCEANRSLSRARWEQGLTAQGNERRVMKPVVQRYLNRVMSERSDEQPRLPGGEPMGSILDFTGCVAADEEAS